MRGPGIGARRIFARVRQVCTVVEDFEATIQNLVEHLGVGPFRCWHFRPPQLHGTTLRGRPEPWSMKLGITWHDDVQWEVIQPMEGATLYRQHLSSHGRGVQHILMDTGALSFEEAADHLSRNQHPFAQTAKLNIPLQVGGFTLPPLPNRLSTPINLQFGYIDAQATLRTTIELTRYPLGIPERLALRLGKAESCIPAGNAHYERALPHRAIGSVVKLTLVTRDLDATMGAYLDVAGVGPWHVFDAANGRVGWGLIDDVLLEVVAPRGGPLQGVLDTRGEGVASIGVLPGPRGWDETLARCSAVGYQTLAGAPLVGDHPAVLFGARAAIGTDLEVLDLGGASIQSHFLGTTPQRIVGR